MYSVDGDIKALPALDHDATESVAPSGHLTFAASSIRGIREIPNLAA
jgi:hypothetical protein